MYDDSDDFDREMFDGFNEAFKSADRKEEEYQRLLGDPCMKIPEVGDTVVVAAGMLGMGHIYVRFGAKVLAVGDSSYFVQFDDYKSYGESENKKMWVNPALITDVIKRD